jgi:hypothetical protein
MSLSYSTHNILLDVQLCNRPVTHASAISTFIGGGGMTFKTGAIDM